MAVDFIRTAGILKRKVGSGRKKSYEPWKSQNYLEDGFDFLSRSAYSAV
jgi:hypothetical protein